MAPQECKTLKRNILQVKIQAICSRNTNDEIKLKSACPTH